jgi:outer membrane protein OmpU|tara:strand:- start:777 stop:1814 length:1038 start_codon:yes stop_codon:yes gene_type:complete
MNKLTKVGLSALCGSLATVASAQAGSLGVKGGATATWSSNQGDTTGNPIGMNSAVTFTGSGELDNGTTFTVTFTGADQAGYTSGGIAITTPSLGSFSINGATGGNGIGGYDDKMPTAWEETWGTSLGTGIDLAKGSGSSMNVQYTTPAIAGATIKLAHSPRNTGGLVNDKSIGGDKASRKGASVDGVLDISAFGQNIFAGYSWSGGTEGADSSGTNKDKNSDHEEGVLGAILSLGPVQAGYQVTGEFLGNEKTTSDVFGYKNTMWGVAFNVNDNLSLSYGEMTSRKGYVSGETVAVEMEVTSMQVAYTMGGATIKIAETEGDNLKYSTGTANSKDATTVALSLAF